MLVEWAFAAWRVVFGVQMLAQLLLQSRKQTCCCCILLEERSLVELGTEAWGWQSLSRLATVQQHQANRTNRVTCIDGWRLGLAHIVCLGLHWSVELENQSCPTLPIHRWQPPNQVSSLIGIASFAASMSWPGLWVQGSARGPQLSRTLLESEVLMPSVLLLLTWARIQTLASDSDTSPATHLHIDSPPRLLVISLSWRLHLMCLCVSLSSFLPPCLSYQPLPLHHHSSCVCLCYLRNWARKSVLEHLQKTEAVRLSSTTKSANHEITLTVGLMLLFLFILISSWPPQAVAMEAEGVVRRQWRGSGGKKQEQRTFIN